MLSQSRVSLPLVALLSFSVSADEPDYFDLSLEALFNISIEVATKSKKSLVDAPSTVSVFTGAEIQAMGVRNLQDLLNLVPGFQSKATGFHGMAKTVAARGRRASQSGFEILVLYDGQRLNNDRIGAAFQLNSNLDLNNVERVEIIRGPGSAIYGSNAFTGVVNLVSKSQRKEAMAFAGSDDNYGAHMAFSGGEPQGANWDLALSGWSEKGPDITAWAFGNSIITTPDEQGSDVNFKFNNGGLSFKARYMERKAQGSYVIENITPDFNRSSQSSSHFNLKYTTEPSEDTQLSVYGFFMMTDWTFQTTLAPFGALMPVSIPASSDPFRGRNIFKTEERGVGAEWTWQVDKDSEFLLGAVFRDPKVDDAYIYNNYDLAMFSNGIYPITYYGEMLPTTLVMKGQDRNIKGIFGQYDTKFGEKLLATFGLRYDDYSDFGDTINPRVGLVYKSSSQHIFKMSYGQAFRAPSSSETGLANNPIILGNPDMQPETVKTWELNWTQQYDDVNLSMTLFDNVFEDAVKLVPVAGSTKVQWNNAEDYENNGVELELFANLSNNIYLRLGYSKYFELPEDAFFLSDELISGSINYSQGSWQINLNGFYHSDIQNVSATVVTPLDDYWLFNSKVQYKLSEQWSFSLVVNNLFDETYYTTDGFMDSPNGVTNQGRRISLETVVNF